MDSIKLIIFGSAPKEISEYILSNQSNAIKFIGWQSPFQVNEIILSADLGVFPGSHSVLWEQCIGSGLPTIFNKWTNLEHFDLGGNTIILDNTDEFYLAEMLSDLLKNQSKLDNMKKTAVERGRIVFSYQQIAKKSLLLDDSIS